MGMAEKAGGMDQKRKEGILWTYLRGFVDSLCLVWRLKCSSQCRADEFNIYKAGAAGGRVGVAAGLALR